MGRYVRVGLSLKENEGLKGRGERLDGCERECPCAGRLVLEEDEGFDGGSKGFCGREAGR